MRSGACMDAWINYYIWCTSILLTLFTSIYIRHFTYMMNRYFVLSSNFLAVCAILLYNMFLLLLWLILEKTTKKEEKRYSFIGLCLWMTLSLCFYFLVEGGLYWNRISCRSLFFDTWIFGKIFLQFNRISYLVMISFVVQVFFLLDAVPFNSCYYCLNY